MSVNPGALPYESRERAVREELNHLLESNSFRNSKRCREFLQYIVEHTLSGANGTLKERVIGVNLFQLPADFDTGQHTIVRVTANEVRKRLAQHYLAENATGHMRIDLPPGSYCAEFNWVPVVEEVAPVEEPVAAPEPAPPELAAPEPPATLPPAAAPEIPAARPGAVTLPLVLCAAAVVIIGGAVLLWLAANAKKTPGSVRLPAVSAAVPGAAPAGEDLRVSVGATNPYMDRNGRTWGPDRFFSGGSVFARPAERILRTLDPDIYRHLREGEFRYDIPLNPGSYEMHLHFAETGLADFISAESSGEGQRLFRASANGKPLLDFFDVVADADGTDVADERVFRDISPDKDGYLHLSFASSLSSRGTAILSGIELLPVGAGEVRPLRIRAGRSSSWQDSAGRQWQADSYFLGGNALVRATNPAGNSNPDTALYSSERWGHFSYALPAADGRYRVTLRFCEGHYGRANTGVGGQGSRLFDVYCNGVALLRSFDIFKEAGGEGRPVDRAFSGIRPNAQGKIVLSFVPIRGMACVNGIEVTEESK